LSLLGWNEVNLNNKLKNSVCTAKKTQRFSITEINWLMMFKEIIAVCSKNNTLCGRLQNYWILK
jgi:hypothetical protein